MANQKDLELFLKGVKAWNEGVENGGAPARLLGVSGAISGPWATCQPRAASQERAADSTVDSERVLIFSRRFGRSRHPVPS